MSRGKICLLTSLLIVAAVTLYVTTRPKTPLAIAAPPQPTADIIPPGIIVTESANAAPAYPIGAAPGDRELQDYASPRTTARQDLVQLTRVISNFLLTHKQAAARPLSANQEWSATLRGLRPGTEPWLSATSSLFDREKNLIDRWQSPLHFHALGHNQWEIRSSGPDKMPHTSDDLTEPLR